MAVLPESQGKGFAKRLLKALEVFAKQSGVSEVRCKVRKNVERNVQLYSNVGYLIYEEELVQLLNGDVIPVVSMKKQVFEEPKTLLAGKEAKTTN